MKKLVIILLFTLLFYPIVGQNTTAADINTEIAAQKTNNVEAKIDSIARQLSLLHTELERLEDSQITISRRISDTREDYKNAIDDSHATRNITLILVSIIVTVLGVLVPFLYNRNANQKQLEFDNKQEDIINNMNSMLSQMNEIKTQVNEMQGKIEESEQKAESYRMQSYINKLYTQASNEEDVDEAIDIYSEIIEIDSTSFDAYLRRAILYMKEGNNRDALCDLNRSIALEPKDYRPYMFRGLVNARMNQYFYAMRDAEIAISYAPKERAVYTTRADIHHIYNKWYDLIWDYNKAAEISPLSAYEYNNRAYAYYKINKLDLALADVEDAIKLDNRCASFYDTRGMIYSKKGTNYYDDALQDYNKAILLDDKLWEAYENRASLYKKMSELETDPEKVKEYRRLSAKDIISFRHKRPEQYVQ